MRFKLGAAIAVITILSGILLAGVPEKREIEMLPSSKENNEQELSSQADLEINSEIDSTIESDKVIRETEELVTIPQAEVDININSQRETEKINYKTSVATTIISEEDLIEIEIDHMFYKEEISDELFASIYGKSFKEACTTPRDELVYIRLLCYGFKGQTHIGELIVNEYIAEDVIEIFKELYSAQYPIEKMVLIDHYNAEDKLSIEDNNTSGFNYRKIAGTKIPSKHALGLAIDINPVYNPYVKKSTNNYEPYNAKAYIDRSKDFLYKIDHNDLAYKLFIKQGFIWGGDWKSIKDYHHFEKNIIRGEMR